VTGILLLGGIGEAVGLASLLGRRYDCVYSLAGKGRMPELACRVRVGGFGGAAGLSAYLRRQGLGLLIDATHPYAEQISHHAVRAAAAARVPLWAYRRPPWQANARDRWIVVDDWSELRRALESFRKPFFTLGSQPLRYRQAIPRGQHWVVRALTVPPEAAPSLTTIGAVGPFRWEDELALMRRHGVDVLVSKNSGGAAVAGKLLAARALGIPVVMLKRPVLPPADREFQDMDLLTASLFQEWAALPAPPTGP
jgi:precorrin-6A/cobalt-precorrin-6A reductase